MAYLKATPEVIAKMIQRWNEGASQKDIAIALNLDLGTVTRALRKTFGVETPEWKGRGRVAIQRQAQKSAITAPVYPDNPTQVEPPCEFSSGEWKRFWSHVAPPNQFGCCLWLGSKNNEGRGEFKVLNSAQLAPRVSWRLVYGPIPDGKQINHRCDVEDCVTPPHFWLGSQKENMHDMRVKGRGSSKLNWDIVREMRRIRNTKGLTLGEIAKRFDISKAQASNICANRQWVE